MIVVDKEKEHEYLLKCFTRASEEIVFRVKHRDAWVKTQFIAQLSIIALGFGVTFGQLDTTAITAKETLHNAFALAFPISFVIAALYFIEENIISLMSRYIANLNRTRAKMFDEVVVNNFDSSQYATDFYKETQVLRIVAQIVAFILLPSLIAAYDIYTNGYSVPEKNLRLIVDIVCFIALIIMMVLAHKARLENLEE